ncbi:hypothetical protein BGZ81_001234, partial [Podila clonocystis]
YQEGLFMQILESQEALSKQALERQEAQLELVLLRQGQPGSRDERSASSSDVLAFPICIIRTHWDHQPEPHSA